MTINRSSARCGLTGTFWTTPLIVHGLSAFNDRCVQLLTVAMNPTITSKKAKRIFMSSPPTRQRNHTH